MGGERIIAKYGVTPEQLAQYIIRENYNCFGATGIQWVLTERFALATNE